MSVNYLLHESSVGYSIWEVKHETSNVGTQLKEVQKNMADLARFGKMVQLVSFAPFHGAAQALENANMISEGQVSEFLHTTLETNLLNRAKKGKLTLGVADKVLAGSIREDFPSVSCETGDTSEVVADLLRGLRLHHEKLVGKLSAGDVDRSQLGLGHSYSRAKVKFSVNRNDNHIIQAIATLDSLDKDVNTFAMRLREWYGWHFPELVKIVSDNATYAKVALFIGNKSTLSDDKEHELAALVNDDAALATAIIESAKISMGQDMSESDMANVMSHARITVSMFNNRKSMANYLSRKMNAVAPNLSTVLGETVSARLISHAGSLTNLAKMPASTVQILGAEKALFRALKTKGNTPKYGLLYHSSFIGRAGTRNKGRISRFLANKCSIASRIDNFAISPSTRFGEALRKQVEERLEFYASGAVPTKNADAMKAALELVSGDVGGDEEDLEAVANGLEISEKKKKKLDKKLEKSEKKEKKKDKKRKSVDADDTEGGAVEKKKKKKTKSAA